MCSREMPAPVSTTSTSTLPLCVAVRTSSMPPLGIASRAFKNRFRNTCCSLFAEPRTAGNVGPSCFTTWICDVFKGCATNDSVSSTTRLTSISASSVALVREKFKRLLTISLPRIAFGHLLRQHLNVIGNHGQGRIHFVRHARCQQSKRRELFGLRHLLFHPLALRNIIEQQQPPDALARLAHQRSDGNIQRQNFALMMQSLFIDARDLFLVTARRDLCRKLFR